MGKGSRAREARRQHVVSPAHQAAHPKRPFPVLWVALATIVVAALVALFIAGRDSKDPSTSTRWGTPYSTIEVRGASLPRYSSTSSTDSAVGKAAPSATGKSMAGREMSVGDIGAEVLVFVAHWCPHCQKEVPLLATYLDKHPVRAGVSLAAIATGTSRSRPNYPPQPWLAEEGWTAPVLLDDAASTAGNTFGLAEFPYFVVIGPDGKVVERASGEISMERFQQLIDAAASGKPSR